MDLFEADSIYVFTLLNGKEKTGQVWLGKTMFLMSGEPLVIALLEGASSSKTYIPWRAVESYKRL